MVGKSSMVSAIVYDVIRATAEAKESVSMEFPQIAQILAGAILFQNSGTRLF